MSIFNSIQLTFASEILLISDSKTTMSKPSDTDESKVKIIALHFKHEYIGSYNPQEKSSYIYIYIVTIFSSSFYMVNSKRKSVEYIKMGKCKPLCGDIIRQGL